MIRIGTRKSRLAMVQTEFVKEKILEAFPQEEIEIVPIITKGDIELNKSLASFGGKGVFTKEIEEQLLDGNIDIAVHSAKDIPMELAEGLSLGAVLEREDCRDVLVTVSGILAKNMPPQSVIGTSSLRRELQMKRINPDITVKTLRGNVPTRLQKLRNGQYDGIILAAAGLKRLELDKEKDLSYEYFETDEFLPAAGQGILAVEIRKGTLGRIMEVLNCREAEAVLFAERKFLTVLGGSCNAPCGVCCEKRTEGFFIRGMYAKNNTAPQYVCMKTHENGFEAAVRLAENIAVKLKVKKVSLVGAGPGVKSAVSGRAMQCIRTADVIIYDNLISPSVLNEAPLNAELIYVGKRANAHSMEQESINRLLTEKALEGGYVVRLKGGDPFIFGRGAEEALALKREGIPYEIVSGISSAYSVPAWAGIPVTHREAASSVHIITGHEGKHKNKCFVDYSVLAKEEGTLIFLMGLNHLEEIAGKLIEGGKSKDTPAAVIQSGGTARQKTVSGTLYTIFGKVKEAGLKTPAIIVVGEVVSLREQINSFEQLPLTGKRILLTGTRSMTAQLERCLEPLGAETASISLIETCAYRQEGTSDLLCKLKEYKWIVFVSAAGVKEFFAALLESRTDRRVLANVKFAVVGESTAKELEIYGYFPDFIPTQYCSRTLAKEWIPQLNASDKCLLIRGKTGSDILEKALKEAHILCNVLCLYETIQDNRRKEELVRIYQDTDYAVIASGSAARAFAYMIAEENRKCKIATIGTETAKACEEAGLTVDLTANRHTAEGIAEVILQDLDGKESSKS